MTIDLRIESDDLRAAVAAGLIDEAQAAGITTLAQGRQGQRGALQDEDEPFELFRGFNEIFITVGIALLFAGIAGVASLVADGVFIPFIALALSWGMAHYFTLRRRMVLPSIVLSGTFALAALATAGMIVGTDTFDGDRWVAFGVFLASACLTAAFYWRFRVPIALLFIGILIILGCLTGAGFFSRNLFANLDDPELLFDLSTNSGFAIMTLGLGIAAFVVAMAYDIRDPHRISRLSACGFWLHLIAAILIVNTVGMSLYNLGGALGYGLTAIALLIIACVALIIDRRSFLTAGILYMAALIGLALETAESGWTTTLTLLALGIFITILGAGWTRLRAALMRSLGAFPFKDRLPPYAETT